MSDATETLQAQVLRARATQAYARQSRHAQEEKWILEHLPLVRHIVQKVSAQFSQRPAEMEDLISAGTLGLVKAAKAFEPARDVEFKTYAYIRIRGAVLDELRSRSFVPSSIHAQMRNVQKAYRKLTAASGRPPDDEQLAAELGISVEQLRRTLEEARKRNFLSIHGLSDEEPALGRIVPADGGPSPAQQAERNETVRRLADAVRELPERHRTIVLLYYERDLTMKEIARVLEITESRVSQLHASALFKLSMKMRDGR